MNDGYLPCLFYSSSLHAVTESTPPPAAAPLTSQPPARSGPSPARRRFESIKGRRDEPRQMLTQILRLPGDAWKLLEPPGNSRSFLESPRGPSPKKQPNGTFDGCVLSNEIMESGFPRQPRGPWVSRPPDTPSGSPRRNTAILPLIIGDQGGRHLTAASQVLLLLLGGETGGIPALRCQKCPVGF